MKKWNIFPLIKLMHDPLDIVELPAFQLPSLNWVDDPSIPFPWLEVSFIYSTVFSQQDESNTVVKDSAMVIKNIVASPNPFSVTTKIKFNTEAVHEIEFSVKDLIGNVVYIKKHTTKIGLNTIAFYRDKLDSGIYIYSIKTNNEIISKRIVVKWVLAQPY